MILASEAADLIVGNRPRSGKGKPKAVHSGERRRRRVKLKECTIKEAGAPVLLFWVSVNGG